MNTDTKTNSVFIPFEEILALLEQAVHQLRENGTPDQMFAPDYDPLQRQAMELREFRTIGFHSPRQCGATSYIERSLTSRSLVVVRNSMILKQHSVNFKLDKKCTLRTLRDVLNMGHEEMLRIHQQGVFDRVFLDEASYMFNDIKNSHIALYTKLAEFTSKDCIVVRVN